MQRTPTAGLRYPTWEDLCQYATAFGERDLTFLGEVERLRQRPPNWRYKVARFLLTNLLKDECYQKFLTCSWSDIIDLMADQVARNRSLLVTDLMASGSSPLSDRAGSRFSRPYGQMPCTRATALRRVAKARELVDLDDPILLLGDDDLVSLELALAGFKDVTAVDIDETVLIEVERATREHGVAVRLCQHDLTKPPPPNLYRDYKLVLFDPEYSVAGVDLFLKAALDLTRGRSGTAFFLSVHLMSLLRPGLELLGELFNEYNLELQEFEQGFNAYPAPSRLKSLIHLLNQIVIGSKTLTTEGYTFPFLLSDALVLRKL